MMLTANPGIMKRCADAAKKAGSCLRMPSEWLRRYYSHVLYTEVSPARARAITEAQAAFFAVTLPLDYPLAIRIAACAWFVAALRKAKNRS